MVEAASGALAGRTILFLVAEDYYFLSHRLNLAKAAKAAGARVIVATRPTGREGEIEAAGLDLEAIDLNRTGRNPLADLGAVRRLIGLYRRTRPDIVHHVAMKPVLYGSFAAWVAGLPAAVNAFAGMGFLFISDTRFARLARPLVIAALRFLIDRPGRVAVVQNRDDRALVETRLGLQPRRLALIPGAGVDTDAFRPPASRAPNDPPVALCMARLLWDKGLGELAEAARILKARGVALRIRLVGPLDGNPAAVPRETVEGWTGEGLIDWAGPTRDAAGAQAGADIAVLPSYREGLPKALLEAAATGLPLVATDVPGCREICRDGETGLLVPPRDAGALADALARLAGDPALRARLGAAARAAVEAEFSDRVVIAQTLALYERLAARAGEK